MCVVAADALAGEQRLDGRIQWTARARYVREPAGDPHHEAVELVTPACQMSELCAGETRESIRGAEAARAPVLQQLSLVTGPLPGSLRVDRAYMSRVM